jgi:hypothetical protein
LIICGVDEHEAKKVYMTVMVVFNYCCSIIIIIIIIITYISSTVIIITYVYSNDLIGNNGVDWLMRCVVDEGAAE